MARLAVAAAAAAFAGDANLTGETDFRGDVGFAKYDFCGDLSSGRIGDWGRVRELADLGERTVDGSVTWRDFAVVVILARFLGLGIASMDWALFSLFAESILSLRLVRIECKAKLNRKTCLVLLVPLVLGTPVGWESSDTAMGFSTLEGATSTAFASRVFCF